MVDDDTADDTVDEDGADDAGTDDGETDKAAVIPTLLVFQTLLLQLPMLDSLTDLLHH